jgi:hypothetical protein
MKKIIGVLAFIVFGVTASAQQINPVPDYIFRYQMSVGRNTFTDTAAYLSVGPRYGATKGFMPPMVADTASVSSTKRNGLLIFSRQKNKFQYWDSAAARWSDIASSGASLSGGVANYMTRWTGSTTIDTSRIYQSAGFIGINTTTPAHVLDVAGTIRALATSEPAIFQSSTGSLLTSYKYSGATVAGYIGNGTAVGVGAGGDFGIRAESNLYFLSGGGNERLKISSTGAAFFKGDLGVGTGSIYYAASGRGVIEINGTSQAFLAYKVSDVQKAYIAYSGSDLEINNLANGIINFVTNSSNRARIKGDGEFLIGTTSDLGAYVLQVSGNTILSGTVTTDAPTDGTAAPWKIGSYYADGPAPSATGYLQVEVNGVKYKVLAATY